MEEAREEAFEAMFALGNTAFQANVCRDHSDMAIDIFLAKLRETHVIVPREPTDAMIVAGVAERHGQPVPEAWSLATVNVYRAMLAAAPPLKE